MLSITIILWHFDEISITKLDVWKNDAVSGIPPFTTVALGLQEGLPKKRGTFFESFNFHNLNYI